MKLSVPYRVYQNQKTNWPQVFVIETLTTNKRYFCSSKSSGALFVNLYMRTTLVWPSSQIRREILYKSQSVNRAVRVFWHIFALRAISSAQESITSWAQEFCCFVFINDFASQVFQIKVITHMLDYFQFFYLPEQHYQNMSNLRCKCQVCFVISFCY
jgi:hypothetical protein